MVEIEKEILEITSFNAIQDMCRKKSYNPIQKAKLLRWYITENELSLRDAEQVLGIPKTTLHDILGYNNLDEERMKELKDAGFSKTDIRRAISSGRISEIHKYNEFDETVKRVITNLQPFSNGKDIELSNETSMLIHRLKELVSKIDFKIGKKR